MAKMPPQNKPRLDPVHVDTDFSRPMQAKKPLRLYQKAAETFENSDERSQTYEFVETVQELASFSPAEKDNSADVTQDEHVDAAQGKAETRSIRRPAALANLPLDDDTSISKNEVSKSVEQATLEKEMQPEHSLPHLQDCGIFARGGFGTIHRVNDLRFQRDVAMKVLENQSDHARARFRVEGQVTAQLQHPNIVPVFEGGRAEDGTPFFTMQLVEGETLKRRAPQMDLHDALQVMLKVCDAVAYAHSRGVIHRDLKPENIMVGDFGQVYVMDWGIALVKDAASFSGTPSFSESVAQVSTALSGTLDQSHMSPIGHLPPPSMHSQEGPVLVQMQAEDPTVDKPGTIIGTASFMAPEQALGRVSDIDERTDVFGLGAILYYLITDRVLYEGETAKERLAQARECAPVAPEVRAPMAKIPPGLRSICLRALSKEKADRPASAADLRAQLDALLRGGWWFDAVSFRAGECIVREGDVADCAYIISVGTAEVYQKNAESSDLDDAHLDAAAAANEGEKVLGSLGVGDVFGETAILTGSPRTASVRATSSLTAMVVTKESMEAQFASDSWAGKLVSTLIRRLRAKEKGE